MPKYKCYLEKNNREKYNRIAFNVKINAGFDNT